MNNFGYLYKQNLKNNHILLLIEIKLNKTTAQFNSSESIESANDESIIIF